MYKVCPEVPIPLFRPPLCYLPSTRPNRSRWFLKPTSFVYCYFSSLQGLVQKLFSSGGQFPGELGSYSVLSQILDRRNPQKISLHSGDSSFSGTLKWETQSETEWDNLTVLPDMTGETVVPSVLLSNFPTTVLFTVGRILCILTEKPTECLGVSHSGLSYKS